MTDEPDVSGVDPAEARRLADSGAVLLDVREDDEWVAGHAPDAVHVAMGLILTTPQLSS